jgi:hypothetical protein
MPNDRDSNFIKSMENIVEFLAVQNSIELEHLNTLTNLFY